MELKNKINQHTTIVGKISEIMWQHMIGHEPDYPEILYFDPKADGVQIVLYSKTKIENKPDKFIKINGFVKEIKGTSKRGQKIDDAKYREYHLIVESYEYVD